MSDDNARTLTSPVWLLYGLTGSEPGLLELVEGRLALTTERGREFEASASEIDQVKFPWYYFSGGMHLTVQGRVYRLSFVKPNQAGDVLAGSSLAGGLLMVGRKASDITQGRKAGRAWRSTLLQLMAPDRSQQRS